MVHWEEGRCVLFDDTYRHEVWNDTNGVRVVLLIDVPRPFPQPLAWVNKAVLCVVRLTPFVTDAVKLERKCACVCRIEHRVNSGYRKSAHSMAAKCDKIEALAGNERFGNCTSRRSHIERFIEARWERQNVSK